jgi:hypothetical protein
MAMDERVRGGIPVWTDRAHRYRFRILLVSLLVLLAVVPLTVASPEGDLVLWIAISLVIVSGLLSMRRERFLLGIAILLGVPVLISHWVAFMDPAIPYELLQALIPISFFVFFTVFLLRSVVTGDEVTGDVIAGALSVYLLLGLTWAFLYQGIALANPGSFHVGSSIAASGPLHWMDFLYYSFITLATVGYGDITPVAPVAQSLAYAEAVTGVIYVAVLVARLVSSIVRFRSKLSSTDPET